MQDYLLQVQLCTMVKAANRFLVLYLHNVAKLLLI